MLKRAIALFTIPLAAFTLSACDVDQTEEGELPDIEVEEGELPEYDVEIREDTVTVPEIEIDEEPDTTGIPR